MKTSLILSVIYLLVFPQVSPAANLPAGIIKPTPFNAPVLEVNDIDGQPFSLAKLRGKWVFVHFWASWCGPCRREVPAIEKMARAIQKEPANNPLAIAFINTSEDEDTVFSFLSVYGAQLRPLMDSNGIATEQWKPRGLPATYLVDPEGIVRYQALGGRPWDSPAYLEFLRGLPNTTQGNSK